MKTNKTKQSEVPNEAGTTEGRTPTPWYIVKAEDHIQIHARGFKGSVVRTTFLDERAKADSEAIVRAVNSFAKVEKVISKIARSKPEEATEYFLNAVNAHDELVAALEKIATKAQESDQPTEGERHSRLYDIGYLARTSLAKAKGSEASFKAEGRK